MKPYYQDSLITLYHGDCRDVAAWREAGVMVTDPPYGMDYKSGWSGRSIEGDGDTAIRDAALAMWRPKPALVFGRWDCPHPADTRMCLTWNKGDWPGMGDLELPWGPSTEEIYVLGHGFSGKRTGSVIHHDRLTGNTRHPNEKPVGLMIRLLRTVPPGVVADPFAGSGATLVACKQLGKMAIGVEKSEEHCRTIVDRLAQDVLDLGGAA